MINPTLKTLLNLLNHFALTLFLYTDTHNG